MSEEIKLEINDDLDLLQPIKGEIVDERDLTQSTEEKQNVSEIVLPPEKQELISDDQYLDTLHEIMTNIREDRQQTSYYLDNIAEMVINGGDATTSSKEAMVNLLKIKVDLQDKMLKTADLMTRLKLKNAYAYSGPHLNAVQQNNFINNGEAINFSKKELIRTINNSKKKKKINLDEEK